MVFATDRDITENHNQTKCRVAEPTPSGYFHKTTPKPKARESLWKRGQKNGKSQRIRGVNCEIVFPFESLKLESLTNTISLT